MNINDLIQSDEYMGINWANVFTSAGINVTALRAQSYAAKVITGYYSFPGSPAVIRETYLIGVLNSYPEVAL